MSWTVTETRAEAADGGGAASMSSVYPADWIELDTKAVDTARVLAADAVEKAGNGHPGTAMSLAPLAYTLFQRVMRHDPSDAGWVRRARLVFSCGHASPTLHTQLRLSGAGLHPAHPQARRPR